MGNMNKARKVGRFGAGITGVSAMLGLIYGGSAQAFPVDVGNSDITINWDQSLRLNAAMRAKNRDPNGPGTTASRDESEFLFNKNDAIAERVDLFSEFDLAYKGMLGLRVSGSAWYDAAYKDHGRSNPALASVANYPGNVFSPYIKRYYQGPSGELNDVFVWTNVKVPAGVANIKLGRFGLLWGEAMFGTASANSIAASMSPGDGQKAAISPGATAKETQLPINQLAATLPLSDGLELSLQYTLEYRASRAAEGGTYFGSSDVSLSGPVVNYAGTVPLYRRDPVNGQKGDIGIMARYSPSWFDGTLGLVYRQYDDKALGYAQAVVAQKFYRLVANRDVKLVGLTANTIVQDMSVGVELSYRKGQGLAGSLDAVSMRPARGETIHGLLNVTKSFGQTSAWSTAALAGELTVMHLQKITDNPTFYQGNTAACASRDITLGCPTRNAVHLAVSFSPTWQQVAPSVDLSAPMVLMRGLKGNGAAIGSGINEGSTVYSLGLSASLYSKHTLALSYNGYAGKHRGTGATFVSNGSANYDKNWLGLSFQTNF